MSRHISLVALAASILATGCGMFDSGPATHGAGSGKPAATLTTPATPSPSTRPAAATSTTRPDAGAFAAAGAPDFQPELYAKAIEDYLQKKAKGPTTVPAVAPAAKASAPVRGSKDNRVVWIEPPGMQPMDAADAARGAELTIQAPTATPHPDDPAPLEIAPSQVIETPTPAPAPPPAAKPAPIELPAGSSDQLESKLAQLVKDYPRDLAAQLDYQLVRMLHGRPVPQVEAVAGLPSEDREALCALLDALSNFRSGTHDDTLLLSRKIRPLIDLSDRLRSQAGLRIPTIALCSRVETYGVYEPVASDKFLAGQDHAVIVYCEVENFSSHLNGQNMWQTDLMHEAVLYNDKGQKVLAEEKKKPVSDLAHNRRRDFFVVRLLKLPRTLPAGQYQLKVTIVDEQAQRVTEASLPIQIVAQ